MSAEDFGERYAAALHAALADPGETALTSAYDLGRVAVRSELSVLDLAAIHHQALLTEVQAAADTSAAERATRTAGDLFLESLSSFAMLERVLRERAEVARLEQRQAALLRRLSGFLGDASLAFDAHASLQEVLHLVAEHALEVVDADACSARLRPTERDPSVLEAAAQATPGELDPGAAGRLDDLYPTLRPDGGSVRLAPGELAEHIPDATFAWLAAPFTALDGRRLGLLQLFALGDQRRFSDVDDAALTQLAQMASATFERIELYRR